MKLLLLISALFISPVFCMEQKPTAITLEKTEDLFKFATRKNLQDPDVQFIISEKLKSYFENPPTELSKSQKLTYSAVCKKIYPDIEDTVEEELDELENLGNNN